MALVNIILILCFLVFAICLPILVFTTQKKEKELSFDLNTIQELANKAINKIETNGYFNLSHNSSSFYGKFLALIIVASFFLCFICFVLFWKTMEFLAPNDNSVKIFFLQDQIVYWLFSFAIGYVALKAKFISLLFKKPKITQQGFSLPRGFSRPKFYKWAEIQKFEANFFRSDKEESIRCCLKSNCALSPTIDKSTFYLDLQFNDYFPFNYQFNNAYELAEFMNLLLAKYKTNTITNEANPT